MFLSLADFTDWSGQVPANATYRTHEWLRGEKLCTYSGRYHLAWCVLACLCLYVMHALWVLCRESALLLSLSSLSLLCLVWLFRSVPMSPGTYWTPSAAIHSFLMFGTKATRSNRMLVCVLVCVCVCVRVAQHRYCYSCQCDVVFLRSLRQKTRRRSPSSHLFLFVSFSSAVPFFVIKPNMIVQGTSH